MGKDLIDKVLIALINNQEVVFKVKRTGAFFSKKWNFNRPIGKFRKEMLSILEICEVIYIVNSDEGLRYEAN